MRLLKLLVFTLALTLPFVLRADDINFDNLPVSTVVSSQYPQAVFSSDPGEVLLTVAQNLGSSLPNFICTAPAAGVIDCTHSVIVKFTSPVNHLTFLGTGVNDTGKVAEVDVFQNGVLSSTVDMMGISTIAPVLVDLSAFTNVTSIDIHDITDLEGISWAFFSSSILARPQCRSRLPLCFWASACSAPSGFRKRLLAR